MGYQGQGGNKRGGKSGGGRGGGGFNHRGGQPAGRGGNRGSSRGGSRGGNRGGNRGSNRGGNRQSYDSGSRSSYGGSDQQYYDQSQQYNDPNSYPSEPQQDYSQQQHQYDQYYQTNGAQPLQGSYHEQAQYSDLNPSPQHYYEYPPHVGDPNGVPPYGNFSKAPSPVDPRAGAYSISSEAVAVPPHSNGAEEQPLAAGATVSSSKQEDPPGSGYTEHSQLPPDAAGGEMNPEVGSTGANSYPPFLTPFDQSGMWVERGYHEDIEKKLQTLKTNYAAQTKKYNDLKEKYKLSQENAEKKIKYQHEKIKKLQAAVHKPEKVTVPDGDEEIEVDAENVKYSNKDTVNKESILNALKAERDVYKSRTEALVIDLKKAQADKVLVLDSAKGVEDQLAEFKEKYLELEKEKEHLQGKLDVLDREPPKSPVYQDVDMNNNYNDDDGSKDLKSLAERKEYYKNKYLKLLEEKNAEQQSFLQVNKRLLEQFLFAPKAES